MQISLEKTGDLEGRIKVEVTEADYAPKVDKELREIGRTRTIPGFRKGHVSIEHLRRMFGKEVKSHVLNEEVYHNVIEYIQKEKIDILGEPLPVEVKAINLDDKDYTFEYEVGLAPKVEVELNKDVKEPFYTIRVTEDMTKEQDEALRKRFGAQVPGEEVEADSLVKGALMQLNADGTVNDAENAIQVVNGIVAPMYFKDKEQAALFAGKKVGDKVVFNPWKTCEGNVAEMASMLSIDKDKAADVKDDFQMAISEIIVLRPAEHNEEFYKEVFHNDAIKTEEDYFNALRQMIANQLLPNSEQMFDRDVHEDLIRRFGSFELPVTFLKKWLLARGQEGLTKENVDEEFEKMVPAIKWELIEGEISRAHEIKVNDEDMLAFAKNTAMQQFAQYGMTNMDDATIENYAKHLLEDKKYAQRIAGAVQQHKLFNVIKALVTIEPKEVSIEEFRKLANPE